MESSSVGMKWNSQLNGHIKSKCSKPPARLFFDEFQNVYWMHELDWGFTMFDVFFVYWMSIECLLIFIESLILVGITIWLFNIAMV